MDAQFASLTLAFKYGTHSDYTAVLSDLDYDTTYYYNVTAWSASVGFRLIVPHQDDASPFRLPGAGR